MRAGVREARRQYERGDVRRRDGDSRAVGGDAGDRVGWGTGRVVLGGVVGVPTRVPPSRPVCRVAGSRAACACGDLMLVVDTDPRRVEAQLAAGWLACPGCGGRLSRWGFTGLRTVRMRDGERSISLRRGCCRGCGVTHVLLPASLTPRRRDGVEVIGDALHRAALGEGHRGIAARLGRPPDTVRGWLRAARQAAEPVRACAARWYVALDVESGPVQPQCSVIADTVEALMLTARA